jgi:hypothetical protein
VYSGGAHLGVALLALRVHSWMMEFIAASVKDKCVDWNRKLTRNPLKIYENKILARPTGIEPVTYRLEGGCSIR